MSVSSRKEKSCCAAQRTRAVKRRHVSFGAPEDDEDDEDEAKKEEAEDGETGLAAEAEEPARCCRYTRMSPAGAHGDAAEPPAPAPASAVAVAVEEACASAVELMSCHESGANADVLKTISSCRTLE